MNNKVKEKMKKMKMMMGEKKEKKGTKMKRLEKEEVTGTAGAGSVSLVLSLKGELKSITLDKGVVNPDEKEILEDLILVAFKDAKTKADEKYNAGLKEATAGLNIPGF